MQVSMRTSQRKTVKKGRKAKKSKKVGTKGSKKKPSRDSKKSKKHSGGSESNAALSKSKSKRNLEVLKSKKGNGSHADSSAPAELPEARAVEPETRVERKRKTTKEDWTEKDWATTPKVYQDRVDLGNGKWRYQVLEDQFWGCSNCRFIYGGCKNCWKPKFKGRTAADVREDESNKSAVSTSSVKGTSKANKDKKGTSKATKDKKGKK